MADTFHNGLFVIGCSIIKYPKKSLGPSFFRSNPLNIVGNQQPIKLLLLSTLHLWVNKQRNPHSHVIVLKAV